MGDKGAPEGKKVQGGYQPKKVIQKGYSPSSEDGQRPKPPKGGSGVQNPKE